MYSYLDGAVYRCPDTNRLWVQMVDGVADLEEAWIHQSDTGAYWCIFRKVKYWHVPCQASDNLWHWLADRVDYWNPPPPEVAQWQSSLKLHRH